MDISALLTKKAAIVGGSTAATTAVVVPVVVTQTGKEDPTTTKEKEGNNVLPKDESQKLEEDSSKEDEDKTEKEPHIPNFSAQLALTDDFYKDFDTPGDCIKRLFPKVEETDFFKTASGASEEVSEATETPVFEASTQASPPDIACYFYNGKRDSKFKLELAIKKGNEGWVWMSGLRPDGEPKQNKLWYREFIVTQTGDKWTVKVGHKGEIPNNTSSNGYLPQYPNFVASNFPVKDLNPETQEDCIKPANTNCPDLKANVAYWKPDNGGKPLVEFASNAGHQVARWKGPDVRPEIYQQGHRKKLYKEGKWHLYKNPDSGASKNEKLIKLEDSKAACLKGNWKELARFCTTASNKEGTSKEIYDIFCK